MYEVKGAGADEIGLNFTGVDLFGHLLNVYWVYKILSERRMNDQRNEERMNDQTNEERMNEERMNDQTNEERMNEGTNEQKTMSKVQYANEFESKLSVICILPESLE